MAAATTPTSGAWQKTRIIPSTHVSVKDTSGLAMMAWVAPLRYKYYFAEDGKLVQDLELIIGAGGPYHIKINKEMNYMTVYVPDGANGFIIPLKSFLISTGDDTPLGTFKTPEKYRWRLMNSGVYAQYATRLGAGLSFLMHSIIYDRPVIEAEIPFAQNWDPTDVNATAEGIAAATAAIMAAAQ